MGEFVILGELPPPPKGVWIKACFRGFIDICKTSDQVCN